MTKIIIMKFKVADGRENEFESLVAERAKTIRKTPGFRQIYLLTPLDNKEYRLVSWWDDVDDPEAWVRKESYELCHNTSHAGLVIGPVPHEVAQVIRQW